MVLSFFCDRFYPEAFVQRQILFSDLNNPVKNEDENRYVLIPDCGCSYAVYSRVISQFIDNVKKMPDVMLLIYITKKQMVEY